MADTVDLGFLGRQVEQILGELREMRLENREARLENRVIKTGFLKVSEMLSRMNQRSDYLDRRISEVHEDTDAMTRMQIGGSLAHLETRLDERFALVEDRFTDLNERLDKTDETMSLFARRTDDRLEELKQLILGLSATTS